MLIEKQICNFTKFEEILNDDMRNNSIVPHLKDFLGLNPEKTLMKKEQSTAEEV